MMQEVSLARSSVPRRPPRGPERYPSLRSRRVFGVRLIAGLHAGAPARDRHVRDLEPAPAALSQDVILGGLGGDPLIAGLEDEAFAVVDYPEVQVQLGPVREGFEDALLSDHLGY